MLKTAIILFLLFINLPLYAGPKVKEGVFIYDPDRQFLPLFQRHQDLVIDNLSSKGYELYGPSGLTRWLSQLEVNYLIQEFPTKNSIGTASLINYHVRSDYPSNEENENKLKNLAATYPEILHLFSIGKSIEGQDIWVMKISDNPTIDEIEPEFKYIANMHGNEVTGREMVIRLIEDMAKGYRARNMKIRKLINNTEIFIIPTMNPDGFSHQRRGNAEYTDLNRDFPDFISDPNNSFEGRSPETRAIMAFQASRFFALSANYHDGATVVNYPWDATYERFPFDKLISKFSYAYAQRIPDMANSNEFTNGITNGADWYIVHGGMQDWSYYWYGDMQITVEVSEWKWPPYDQIEGFYRQHKDSMINYIKNIHQGVGFAFNGENVQGKVNIKQLIPQRKDWGDFPFDRSQFYKVLEKGKYLLTVTTEDGKEYQFQSWVSGIVKRTSAYKILD